ncbi:MAG: alpha/beta hydrolase, partial [Candidatus Acidiferrales bacterium]
LCVTSASAQVKKQDADLSAPDGVKLKVTYYSAGKPGPGILLMHQCNRERKTWDPFATQLAESGFHVLTLDYRGYGESGGDRFASLAPEQQAAAQQKWPGDIDTAFQYLLGQSGVDHARIGAGGASCGVNNSIQLARRHSEVKTLVLLSGGTDQYGIKFLENANALPIFVAASEDDDGVLPTMRWIMAFSRNPEDKLVSFKAAGHGTEMFKVEKGLEPMILEWYKKMLLEGGVTVTAKTVSNPSPIAEFWDALIQPGGAARARSMFEEAKKKDSNTFLFPEQAVNVLGYSYMQAGDIKGAIEVFKLNELAYPRSANVYDSLGDAYMADHQNELAIQYSEKALKMLAEHPDDPNFDQQIRESAEGKLRKLKTQ